ncbi:MAG: hypothetical protein MK364_02730, partial [Pirellulales bacterium]|nr:hypothetical protein [Pirellulales bacterium]
YAFKVENRFMVLKATVRDSRVQPLAEVPPRERRGAKVELVQRILAHDPLQVVTADRYLSGHAVSVHSIRAYHGSHDNRGLRI